MSVAFEGVKFLSIDSMTLIAEEMTPNFKRLLGDKLHIDLKNTVI